MATVQIIEIPFQGQIGYDLKICSASATVEDYRQALNEWIEKSPTLSRIRNSQQKTCLGCNRCCQERIPLTIIDAYAFMKSSQLPKSLEALQTAMQRWGYITIDGPVIDIQLRQKRNRCCFFLDPQSNRCSIYPDRPFVCQTYICCPSSSRAQDLRSAIVNTGEDELVHQWLSLWAQNKPDFSQNPPVNSSRNPAISLADWSATVFHSANNWSQINLKNICTSSLWRALYQP